MAQNKIFIGNVSFNADESVLREHFEQFGTIEQVAIPTDRERGRPRGFAFITFESQQAAQEALSLDGTEIDGRKIAVNMAQEKSGGRSGDREYRRGGGGSNY